MRCTLFLMYYYWLAYRERKGNAFTSFPRFGVRVYPDDAAAEPPGAAHQRQLRRPELLHPVRFDLHFEHVVPDVLLLAGLPRQNEQRIHVVPPVPGPFLPVSDCVPGPLAQ